MEMMNPMIYVLMLFLMVWAVLKSLKSYKKAISGTGPADARIWQMYLHIWNGKEIDETYAWLRVRAHIVSFLNNDPDYQQLIDAVNQQIKLTRRLRVA